MLISPPFLPESLADNEAFVAAAMPDGADIAPGSGGAPLGSYPLTTALTWHNGLHLRAPRDAQNRAAPVRAIADGTVIFKREPRTSNATAGDPQNYNPYGLEPAWTDNGILILRHSTEIGATADVPTRLTYYSVYMHLCGIAATVTEGGSVWRKDPIGIAGRILGREDHLHFEICLSPTHLRTLLGSARECIWTDPSRAPTADGRIDSVFGSIHIYLPAGTPTRSSFPASHLREGNASRGGSSAATDHFPPDTLRTAQWVEILHQRGNTTYRSYLASGPHAGEPIGSAHIAQGFEYDLYTEACARHDSLGAAVRVGSSPSGWYELLRFGRNLGPDALPAHAANWQKIPTADGTVWVDLNAAGTFKFSDADFPGYRGWQCFDDDTSEDNQRCDSSHLKSLLRDPSIPERIREREALARRLGQHDIREKLSRAICRFPTEWDRRTIAKRYEWLKVDEEFRVESGKEWDEFKAHAEAISFDDLPTEYVDAVWHFHPRAFISHMRKCGWLSRGEMVQCIPRVSPAGGIPLATARTRVDTWCVAINAMARKFGLDSPLRMTHLLAQVWAETGYLRLTREAGADHARYAPYIGRGLIQITWKDKYDAYADFAKLGTPPANSFNLELIATDPYHAGNSSGFYWVSKTYLEPRKTSSINLSRIADTGWSTNSIGKLCLWINGGGNHYDHRHVHAIFIARVLDDIGHARSTATETVTFPKMEFDRESSVVNGRSTRRVVGTQTSNDSMTISVNFTPQR
ncbi:M23 family metallopeptidase [Variovorax paradoxus]|uniref:M23 family metallopeptidase n=1 Tax=Variovorax paradoxus TaxID=34073 RepID=UPI0019336CCC|nr:M23 family metallopeptidase [Variovorax paradoxus]